MIGRPPKTDAQLLESMLERFWSKANKRGPDECWEWTGQRSPRGYGILKTRGVRTAIASRVSWWIHRGAWPEIFVCHKCDNPPCVNPNHLFLGTTRDNALDMMSKGRGRYILPPVVVGDEHPTIKLSDKQVMDIRATKLLCRITYQALADRYGISVGHCHDIINFKKRQVSSAAAKGKRVR